MAQENGIIGHHAFKFFLTHSRSRKMSHPSWEHAPIVGIAYKAEDKVEESYSCKATGKGVGKVTSRGLV